MKFKYQAKTKTGEQQVGFVEAGSKEAAVTVLTGHELFVLSIEQVGKERWYHRIEAYFGRVKKKDLVIFTRQMATLLEAHLPLTDILQTLYEQTEHPVLKEVAFQISGDVDAGLSFSQSLERQRAVFSEFFVSMVRSAELTGNMERVMGFLADYMEKEFILMKKAQAALIYPVLIILLFGGVAMLMLIVVFPQITPIFEQSGVELPLFTRILLGIGAFLGDWWIALAVLGFIAILMILDYLQTEEGRALRDDMTVRLPIIKKIFLPLTITRLSNTAAMLLRGGIPMTQSIQIAGQTIGNVLYRDILIAVADEVRQGVRLAEAVRRYPVYFPPLVSQMLAVGEATGQTDQMFQRVGEFYGREADQVVGNIVELIQPILMIVIGILVGILFASVLLPIYQLTGSI